MSYRYNPWTSEEMTRLLESSTSGVPIHIIAKQHNRTPNAIRMRLERLTLNHILAGKSSAEAIRLTGLPMKVVQTSGNPNSVHPMFATMVSRNDLKSLHQERKIKDTITTVERLASNQITPAAERGLTRVELTQGRYDEIVRQCRPITQFQPTLKELIDPLRQKFPEVDINFVEEMVEEAHPKGTYRKVQKIAIDWS